MSVAPVSSQPDKVYLCFSEGFHQLEPISVLTLQDSSRADAAP